MPRIKVVAGVEPAFANSYDDAVDEALRAAVQAGKVHAVGSCGLGSAGEPTMPAAEDREPRMRAFRRQIALAAEYDLPLVVQANGAHGETRSLLEEGGFPLGQVLVRAFRGSNEELQAWAQAGSYVSFGGWSADDPVGLCHMLQHVPSDRVLVESCAPEETMDALAGMPARCDQVVFVADAIRTQISAEQIMSNAAAFYRLK